MVFLSAEGIVGRSPREAAERLFARCDQELGALGLSLEQTVRTRIWGRDRRARDEASLARVATLTGARRSAGSSYIAPGHFASAADVALDLVAVRPRAGDSQKVLREYEPPIAPLRYLVFEGLVVLSGVTAVLPTLEEQMEEILGAIGGSLQESGASWEQVVSVDCHVHRTQTHEMVGQHLRRLVPALAEVERVSYSPVDEYSSEGKLIEIEVTARM